MKYFFRNILANLLSIWLTDQLLPAFTVNGGLTTYLIAAVILTILQSFIQPLLKILFLPFNILTLGFLSWVIYVVILFLLTLIVPSITLEAWLFPGIIWNGFHVPSVQLSYTYVIVISSLVLTAFGSITRRIIES